MIIDCHVHTPPLGKSLGIARTDAECRRNGVRLILVSSLGRWSQNPDSEEVRQANDQARAFAARSKGLARWLAYLNPQNRNWRAEFIRCAAAGAIGIKLWVSLKDRRGRLNRTRKVISHASEVGLPLLIHTFSRTDGNLPGEVNFAEFAGLAREFPKARMIAAHAGFQWRQEHGLFRELSENACVDLAGGFPELGMTEAIVAQLGAERVLFGSDMPGRTLASQLAKVALANLDTATKRLILVENSRRIFQLGSLRGRQRHRDVGAAGTTLPSATVDHFCFCGRWPFFPTPASTPHALDLLLRGSGVRKAYAADLGTIYRKDLYDANAAFVRACRKCVRIAPLAAVNPREFTWRTTLRGCDKRFAGVVVYPALHGWSLAREGRELFAECAVRRIPVWINTALGDIRCRHDSQTWRPVAQDELAEFLRTAPENGYVFQGLNPNQAQAALPAMLRRRLFRFEISRLTDFPGYLQRCVQLGGKPLMVIGSEFPFRNLKEVRWTAGRLVR